MKIHRRRRGWRTAAGGLTVALMVAAGPARALDCATDLTQTAMNICAERDFEAADAALNAEYGSLVKETALADRLGKLRAAERAWVDYRTTQCAFEGSAVDGGSMQPMVVTGCAKVLTERRTAELKTALTCAHDPSTC